MASPFRPFGKFDTNSKVAATTQHRPARPKVEQLEDRLTPALDIIGFSINGSVPDVAPLFLEATAENANLAIQFTTDFTDIVNGGTLTINFGDGITETDTFPIIAGSNIVNLLNHIYNFADDNPTGTQSDLFTASVTISAAGVGNSDTETANGTISDVAPGGLSLTGGGGSGVEGSFGVTLTGTFTETSIADTHTVSVAWGDGTTTTAGPIGPGATSYAYTITHLYADDNPTGTPSDVNTVSLSIVDDDTLSVSGTALVTVSNAAPAGLAITGFTPTALVEGDTQSLTITFTDAGTLDTFTATIFWGDGATTTHALAAGTTSFATTHVYADDNPTGTSSDAATVTVSLQDDDTGTASAGAAVTVSDAAPALSGIASISDASPDEGQTFTFTVTFADAGTLDTFTLTFSWGDGTTNTFAVGAGTNPHTLSASHIYADDNPTGTPFDTTNITVAVIDDDTLSNAQVYGIITINDVAPGGIGISPLAPINEGAPFTMTITFTDASSLDTFTATVDLGGGSTTSIALPAGTTSFTVTHQFADDNPTGTSSDLATISVTILDDDTLQGSATVGVTVNDLAPGGISVTPSSTAFTEGTTITVTVTFSDASSLDTFTGTISWGDSTTGTFTVGAGANPRTIALTHVFADDNPTGTSSDQNTISVSIVDDDTLAGTGSALVTVSDVAPGGIAIAQSATTINEGTTQTITVTFSDAGTLDTFTATVTWGDGITDTFAVGAGANPRSFTATHVYLDDNPTGTPSDVNTVSVSIIDDDTLTGSASAGVTVNNVAPTLTGSVSPLSMNEGGTGTLVLTVTDPGVLDTFTATLTWGDGSTQTVSFSHPGGGATFTTSFTHLYLDDNPTSTPADLNRLFVSIVDDDTGSAGPIAVDTILINNIAPFVTGIGISTNPIVENGTITITVTFTDPGILDTFTTTLDFGDGTPTQTATFALGTTSFTASHQYLDDNPSGTPADVYSISVTVRDDDNGTTIGSAQVSVNNSAPAAGATASSTSFAEGTTQTVTVTLSDAGTLDPHTVSVVWGDGTSESITLAAGVTSVTASHLYADDTPSGTPSDAATINVVVVDDDTGLAASAIPITINNVAPAITGIASSSPVVEGSATTLSVTISDASSLDTFTATINWGDGTFGTRALAAGTTSFTAAHVYADDSPTGTATDAVTIDVTITDDDTGTASSTVGITVNNAAPVGLAAVATTPVSEGSMATVTVTFADAGALDPHTVTVSWGDGGTNTFALSAGTTSITASHLYVDDDPTGTAADTYTVDVAITDDDTGTAAASTSLVVNNIAPTITLVNASPSPVTEASAVTLTVQLSDPGVLDPHTVTVSWGDGSSNTFALAAGVTSLTTTHTYADDDPTGTSADAYAINVAVADDDLGTAATTFGLVVANAAPVVTGIAASSPVNEGSSTTVTVSFTDASSLDTFVATINWGDGSTGSVALAAGTTSFTAAHLYADDNPTATPADLVAIAVTIADDDTGTVMATANITVNNVAPVISGTASSTPVNEGSATTLTVTFSDAGLLDTFVATIDWGDGSTGTVAIGAGATSFTAAHTYADDNPTGTATDAVTINVTLTDDDTGSAASTVSVTVNNVAPGAVSVAPSTPVNEGSATTLTVTFSDAGVLDTHTVTVQWGDGSSNTYALAAGVTSVTAAHVYVDDDPTGTAADVYTVSVDVADDDTGTAAATGALTVNNVAPAITGVNAGPNPVSEASATTITVTLSDAGVADTHTVTVSWGDGSSNTFALAAGVTSVTAVHTYADDNPTGTSADTVNVTVNVADDDTGTASAVYGLVVANVAPVVTGIAASSPVNEGSSTTVTVSFTDASSLDTFVATINWGDGSTGSVALAAGTTSFTAAHLYADDNPTATPADLVAIAVTIADDDTGTVMATANITVNNVAPVIAGTAASTPVNEGSATTLTVTFSDAGLLDTFVATIDWGDGSTGTVAVGAGATSFTAAHTYADDNPTGTATDAVTINVTLTDDDTGSAASTTSITVNNVAPGAVSVAPSTPVNEGGATTLTVTFSDAGVLDTHTVTVQWGDGSSNTFALAAGVTSVTAAHTYVDDDPTGTAADGYTISVDVVDDDTGTAAATGALTVNNVAPAITGVNAGPNPVSEASATTITVTLSDAGVADTHTVTVNWGDGSSNTFALAAGVTSVTAVHTYADDNPTGTSADTYVVSIDVADDDTGTANATFGVVVANVAPVITGVATSSPVDEGGSLTVTVTFSDASSLDSFVATINWGDGSTGSVALAAGTTSFTAAHLYADDNPTATPADLVAIAVTIADDDTGTVMATANITVNNVAPVITGTAASTPVNEGSATTLTVTFSDAGLLDTFVATIDWGDGSTGTVAVGAGATSFTAAHTYADDNPTGTPSDVVNIVVTLTDDDTGVAGSSTSVTVNNVAPGAVSVAPSTPVNEGSATTLTVTFSDAGVLDTHTVTVQWGDGSSNTFALAAGVTSMTTAHVYVDDDPTGTLADVYTVSVDVVDDDTGTAAATGALTVFNVAPAITGVNAGPNPVSEASSTTLTVTLSDAGVADTHTVTVNWGDGSSNTFALAAGVTSVTAAHTYADDDPTGTIADTYVVSIDVVDDDTGTANATYGLVVANTAPVVTGVATSSPVDEGGTLTVTVTFTDASSLDSFVASINWGDGSTGSVALAAGTTSFTAAHTYADDSPTATAADAVTILVIVADDDTGSVAATTNVTVNNVAPAITGIATSTPVDEGSATTLTVTISDASSLDTFTATINWGDGTSGTRALAAGTTSFTASHVYVDDNPTGTPSDPFTINVSLTDDDTGTAGASTALTVNNVAPGAVGVTAVSPSNEGSAASITVTFSDAGVADTHTVAVSWGDGSTTTYALGAGVTSLAATHVYVDDDPTGTPSDAVAIAVAVADDDTGTAAATGSLTVNNVAPGGVTIQSSIPVLEGGVSSLTVGFSDPGIADTHTVTVAWGDGSSDTFALAAGVTSVTATHIFADDNPTNTPLDFIGVSVSVVDDDTGSASGQAAIGIADVAPGGIAAGASGPIDEGGATTLTVTFSDASSLDTFTATIVWGDGSSNTLALAAGTTSFTAVHTYADDAPSGTASDTFAIEVTIRDDDTLSNGAGTTVVVNNVAPGAVAVAASTPVDEGGVQTITVTFSDASSLDTFVATITWGDGATENVAVVAGATSFTATHRYVDDDPTGTATDTTTVSVVITDDDTGTAGASTTAVLNNVAPGGAGVLSSPSAEGSVATITVTFSDVGVADTHTVAVAWGDGGSNTFALAAGVTSVTATHIYADDNPSGTPFDVAGVSVSVTDDDTGTASGSAGVLVMDVAPGGIGVLSAAVDEGSAATVTVTFSDASSLDSFIATVSWGTSATVTVAVPAGATSFTASHQFVDDDPSGTASDTIPVTVSMRDDDSLIGSGGGTIVVNNVAPGGVALTGASVVEGSTVTVTVTFSDISASDSFTAALAWGDGSTSTYTLAAGTTSFTAAHSYVDDNPTGTSADITAITVTITDDDTGTATGTGTVTVVNAAPVVASITGGPSAVTEGSTLTLTVNLTDVGVADAHTATVAWGDGTTNSFALAAGVTSFTATHVFADDSPTGTTSDVSNVVVTIRDDDTGTASAAFAIAVENATAQGLRVTTAGTATEGSPTTITVTFTDAGVLDTHTATVNWGDGITQTVAVGAGVTSFTATHTYADDSPTDTPSDPVTISVSVTDDDGGPATFQTGGITVVNANPVVGGLTAGGTVNLGEPATVTGTVTDAGTLDSQLVTISWGDGTTSDVVVQPGVTTFSASHIYESDDLAPQKSTTFTVTAFATDDDRGVGAKAVPVTGTGFTIFNPLPGLETLASAYAAGTDVGVGAQVRVFNPDHTQRFFFDPGFPAGFTGGVRVATGDVTGDGVDDILVGAGPGMKTLVKLFDGVTRAEIFTLQPFEDGFTGGVFVTLGDITGDGKADIVITPDEGGGPRVRIFAMKTPGAITQVDDFFGIEDTDFRGGARAAVGDINADGNGDLIVAAGFTGGPRIAAWDGKSLGFPDRQRVKIFADFFVFETTLRNGAFIASGDVNGDGFADIVTGGGPGGAPRVRTFSGKALVQGGQTVELNNFFAGPIQDREGIHVAVKNLNGDQFADVVTGSATTPRVIVFDGVKSTTATAGQLPEDTQFDAFGGVPTIGVFVG